MARHLFPKLTLAIFFVATAIPAFSQVAPAATEGGLPLVVGVGFSDYDIDWGFGKRMAGISAFVDYDLDHLPGPLRNFSLQAEGHAIDYGRPSYLPGLRQDTGLGGAIYTWHHFRNLNPYAKYEVGIGSVDFPPFGHYSHDTFFVYAPGGGVEYHVWRQLWVRGDYEYQFWHHTFGPFDLNPQGFTIDASYHFRRTYPHSR
jgi:opacity protein-like surface antigen